MNIVFAAASLFAVSLAATGCNRPKQESTAPDSSAQIPATQAVQSAAIDSNAVQEELQGRAISALDDAKLYCMGMILYAQKHQNILPTNLSQTLPYLRPINSLPSGTNRFSIVYHGSLEKLPNPMTNGIILIRSDSWQRKDGNWTRIYGFVDGHCEAHSETDDNFDAWEKQHSVRP